MPITAAPSFIEVEGRRIATLASAGAAPGLMWLPGFKSDMVSTKATALADWAAKKGLASTRFDYSGHGQSSGDFKDGRIGKWLDEATAVFTKLTTGPQIVVGSSMGGYIALLLLRRLHAIRTGACCPHPCPGAGRSGLGHDRGTDVVTLQRGDEGRRFAKKASGKGPAPTVTLMPLPSASSRRGGNTCSRANRGIRDARSGSFTAGSTPMSPGNTPRT